MLVFHIVAGALGLVSGYIALYASKGAALHRRIGWVFVVSMVAMAVLGVAVTLVDGVGLAVNGPAGLLTGYLVITGVLALRPAPRWLAIAGMLYALGVGATALRFGLEALANGGERDGIPAFPFLLFGGVGLLASIGDYRMIRAGGVHGATRVARHLWRMSTALLFAALSFFLGQAKVIPMPLRIAPLLFVPILAVLVTMIYWLWRLSIRRAYAALRTRRRWASSSFLISRASSAARSSAVASRRPPHSAA